MKPPLLDRINGGDVLVADGAMGTLLFQRGLEPGACPEAFNLSNPEILQDIARNYLDAGADIIQTNTFGGSSVKLGDYGLEDQTEAINEAAVISVRKTVGDTAYVSGSCGPSGKMLKPYGDADPDDLSRGFFRQNSALIAAGADVICVETMTDLKEATLAIEAAKTASPQTPVMATMTFDETPRGFFTIMGVSITEAAEGLQVAGADIIGSNCGNGIDNMIEIARQLKQTSALPLIIQSNAGIPRMEGRELAYDEVPALFGEKTEELIQAGVSIVGGCCGTTPEHISAIRSAASIHVKAVKPVLD